VDEAKSTKGTIINPVLPRLLERELSMIYGVLLLLLENATYVWHDKYWMLLLNGTHEVFCLT